MTIGAATSPSRDQLVEGEAGPRALAVAEPADPRRQPLERDPRLGHLDPAPQARVLREQRRGRRDRSGRCPPGRPTAPPSGTGPGPRRTAAGCRPARSPGSRTRRRRRPPGPPRAGCCRSRRRRRPARWKASIARTWSAIERVERADVLVGLASRSAAASASGDLGRHVAAERVVRGGLVGDEVEPLAGGRPGRLDLGGVADEGDREVARPSAAAARAQRERLCRVVGQLVDVADLEPSPRPRRVDLDGQAHAVVHRHGQRLRAAHAAEAGGQRDRPAERAAEVLAGRLGERLVRALQDALRADVDPRSGGHLAVHHQARPLELAEVLPGRPLADEVRVGDEDARRPGVRAQDADRLAATGSAASRRRPAPRSSRTIASNASQLRAARPVPP